MKQHARELRRLVRRLGWFAAAGLAMLLAAVLLHFGGARPVLSEVEASRLKLATLREQLGAGGHRFGEPIAKSVPEQLRAFREFLPRSESLPRWLDALHASARGTGVAIRSGEYRLERQEGGLLRYHVTLPVTGNYTQLRQFVNAVLQDVPAASLDDVQLRREAGAADRLEARLRFSIHFAGQ
ncbi:hypothetical protein EZ313_01495 [Ramlibacter henchirensis]|uniref:Pilus assembly protein PilO n=1 Tax=Ramlibacter henchirensis TaxID=204072 RepID=A0A4Z0C5P8_9BURK|nr:type 4a pilus biogenesis protein PilO [Ramlibacter henchirensis]TFZ05375.1 hypothetical protein EZ313_01495 [Ramlibacter henchirensis]